MGSKNVLLAKTRGTVIMHHVFKAYEIANEQDLRSHRTAPYALKTARARIRALQRSRSAAPCSRPGGKSIGVVGGETAATKTST
jgi:hypothetical protein